MAPAIVHDVLRSPGQPLDPATRGFMEPRFGHDFRQVRVHTDVRASESARAVNALAYTVGSNVVFGTGQYASGTVGGQRLLAHELAHVIQQSASAGAPPAALPIGAHHGAGEHEANRAAEGDSPGRSAALSRLPAGAALLQRQGPGGFPGSLEPGCSVDLQAVLEGKSDITTFLNCCAKLPIAGKTCSKDVIDGVRKLKGLGKGGTRPSGPTIPKLNCPGRETPFGTCCPEAEAWNGAICAKPTAPVGEKCLPGEKRTLLGGCCTPGQLHDHQGSPCLIVPDPQKPPVRPPVPPLPGPVEVFFQLDRPRASDSGAAGFRTSATGVGLANFAGVIETLRGDPALQFHLVGRASPEGTVEYNRALGARRVEVVVAAVADEGVSTTRVADAPTSDLKSECQRLGPGLATCGKVGSFGPRDRQVLVRFFRSGTP